VKYFNFLVSVLFIILYAAGRIPPSEKYNLWLISFIIPVALAANAILLLVGIAMRKKSSLYYVLAFIIGSNYLISSVGLKFIFKSSKPSDFTFNVLSFNIGANLERHEASEHESSEDHPMSLSEWIIRNDADVQCYQEFIDRRQKLSGFDILNRLKSKGYHSYFSFDSLNSNRYGLVLGTLITSKFPIIKSGDVLASENGFNRISYADLLIRTDTVRVINVHLESMGLKQFHPANASGFESRKKNTRILFSKLKEGVFERSEQIKVLAEFVERSPHRVVCAGDFNELPYSYSYQFLRKRMKNAFEEVGKGFGFSYNGHTLRVLRIDNQFYSTGLAAAKFVTHNDIQLSDHFPLEGTYKIVTTQ
jgi:endonuclease/exonuclease/phosphatase family metal-dependent hydrolase